MNLDVLNEALAKTVTRNSADELAITQTCDMVNSLRIDPLETSTVRQMLSSMKTKTATGPDGLSATLLKNLAAAIAPNVTAIMNCSLEEGVFPTEWKKANVAAIWKAKGSKSDPTNYRPISVLPVLARLFEKIVARKLSEHCYGNNVMDSSETWFVTLLPDGLSLTRLCRDATGRRFLLQAAQLTATSTLTQTDIQS